MRIAINLTRDYIGGITSSNANLMSYVQSKHHEFVGIELNAKKYLKGSVIFRSFPPEKFDHHIINIHELEFKKIIKKVKTYKELERIYAETISLIRNVLRTTKPDVVLLNGTYYMPWLISIAAEKEGIPIVLWYAGVLKREVITFPKSTHPIFHVMEKSIIARAKRIIFPSTICRKIVEQEVLGKKVKHSYIVPNPISNSFLNRNGFVPSSGRNIALVARYNKIKNFKAFFDLHRLLIEKKWKHTATIVTDVEDFKIKNIPRAVEVLPPMDPEGIKKFYSTQGLVICPSLFETFGNVPMEAALLGLPVLVSDQMGCSEILHKVGLSNMVVNFKNLSEVAERVRSLCGKRISKDKLRALERILDHRFIGEEILAVLKDAQK